MTLNQLVGECCARENCTIDGKGCPFERECDIFEDIYGHLPLEMKTLSEREKTAVLIRIRKSLGGGN